MNAFTSGRSSRREYWISIAAVLALATGLAFTPLPPRAFNIGFTIAWLWIWARRLHDIGRSAWWSAVPLLVITAVVVASFVLGGSEMLDTFGATQADAQVPVSDKGLYEVVAMLLLVLAIQLGFTLWLGIKRGDPGPNKWGEARS